MNLETFTKWAKDEWGWSESDIAREADISPSYFTELLAGKKIARPVIARKIEKASKGLVTAIEVVADFYKTEPN